MSSTHAKLRLDEQSFQDLLAAAFTIQEHNAKRKMLTAKRKLCGHCGSPLPDGQDFCVHCGSDPQGLRSGERLQRNWASMWLKSQGQDLQPAEQVDPIDAVDVEELDARIAPSTYEEIEKESFDPGLRISEVAEEFGPVPKLEEEFFEEAAPESATTEIPGAETYTHETGAHEEPTTAVSKHDDGIVRFDFAGEPAAEPELDAPLARFQWSELAFWKKPLKLRFDRSDFYLGLAIVVAAFVIIWAATSNSAVPSANAASRRPHLTFWEKTLVDLGLAEAPDPPMYRGDPKVQVWVDPHTALYYCAGEDQYGKTPDGHYSSQRDAQMDQFEPSARAACE